MALSTIPTRALSEQGINFRNLIINGDMRIDQRNAGAAVTASGSYPVDRFNVNNTSDGSFSAQQSSTVPAGFSKSVGVTITASDSSLTGTQRLVLRQTIEGYNIADFNWGTSDAKTVTLSFKVRSSVTGTFSGSLRNSAGDRSYPFTYSISSANTWTDISVTIAGETTGSWDITNGEGILVFFSLGVGPDLQGTAGAWASGNYWGASGETQLVNTNGATFYITGVQLEAGTTASDFEFLPYDVNLRRCMRYYQTYQSGGMICWSGTTISGANYFQQVRHIVQMRASATIGNFTVAGLNGFASGDPSIDYGDPLGFRATKQSNGNTNEAYFMYKYTADAEL